MSLQSEKFKKMHTHTHICIQDAWERNSKRTIKQKKHATHTKRKICYRKKRSPNRILHLCLTWSSANSLFAYSLALAHMTHSQETTAAAAAVAMASTYNKIKENNEIKQWKSKRRGSAMHILYLNIIFRFSAFDLRGTSQKSRYVN